MKKLKLALCTGLMMASLVSSAFAANFNDVKFGDWYYDTITEMSNLEYLSGYEDGSFKPNSEIGAAEFVTILARVVNMPTGANDSHWSGLTMENALEAGWFTADEISANEYNEGISRELVAKVLAIALEKDIDKSTPENAIADLDDVSKKYLDYVLTGYNEDLWTGDQNGKFNPKQGLTRAEASTLIARAGKIKIPTVTTPPTTSTTKGYDYTELWDVLKNDKSLGLVSKWDDGRGGIYDTKPSGISAKEFLVSNDLALQKVTISKMQYDTGIHIALVEKPVFTSNGEFMAEDGSQLNGDTSGYWSSTDGAFKGISGYTLKSRQYANEILKVVLPTSGDEVYDLIVPAIKGEFNEKYCPWFGEYKTYRHYEGKLVLVGNAPREFNGNEGTFIEIVDINAENTEQMNRVLDPDYDLVIPKSSNLVEQLIEDYELDKQ